MQKRKYEITDYQELNRKITMLKIEIDWTARQLKECKSRNDLYYMLGGRIKKLERMIEPLQQGCDTIKECIASVPDPVQRELLKLRYIDFLSWEKIADEMMYSSRNLFHIKKKALGAYQAACEADQEAKAGHQRTPK